MNPFFWLTKKSFLLYFKLFYGHKVYGLEHFFNGRAIIAPNHTSFFDPPMIAGSWPEETFYLARKTLFTSRFFGPMISRLNAYPVTGTPQDLSSIKIICKLLLENKKVVIFPEGVRSFDGSIGSIKSGIGMLALRCKAPIIPTYISGNFQTWNRHQKFPKMKGKTACIFGSAIDPQQYEHLEKKEAQEKIALQVKESIEKLQAWYENGAHGTPP